MILGALPSCCSTSGIQTMKLSGITFHRFSKDPLRKHLWIEFVGRGDWKSSKYSVLCPRHFLEQYMDHTSLSYVRLKGDAIPIINQNDSPVPNKIQILSHTVIRPTTGKIEVVASIPYNILVKM